MLEFIQVQPLSQLPTITDPLDIDGYTRPGSTRNTLPNGNDAALKIEIDGSLAGTSHGLIVTAGSSQFRGLVINQFARDIIRLEGLGGNTVEGSFIGVDPLARSLGNGTSGVGQPASSFFEFELDSVSRSLEAPRTISLGPTETTPETSASEM
ncbi:MAG: hypothetical protein U0930_18985 [Pirellulales bacterium]